MSNIIDITISKIKSLEIQGATNIVKASLNTLRKWGREKKQISFEDYKIQAENLYKARPTEPFVTNVLKWTIKKLEEKGIDKVEEVIEETEKIINGITEKNINNGIETLKGKKIILTHCHSSNVEEILKRLREKEKNLQVFVTQTEPLHQGETTAKNLAAAGVKVTVITDGEAAFMISKEDKQIIDAVLIGVDAILKDGSIINKVGSYGIALSAWKAKIPLLVVASLLKFTNNKIKIEERKGSEIWDKPPEGVLIFNPAFDKVPKDFITGIITEEGTLRVDEVLDKVKKLYPWIVNNNV